MERWVVGKPEIVSVTSSTPVNVGGQTRQGYTKHLTKSRRNSYYIISENKAREIEEKLFLQEIESGKLIPSEMKRTGYIDLDAGQEVGYFISQGEGKLVTSIRIYWEKIGEFFAIHGYPIKIR